MAKGQQPYFQNLNIYDGLASNNVYSCIQDSKGFIWFGTDMGVSRFDGYDFENFTSKDGLTGNEIFGIYEDSQYRIWFLSYNGEFCFYQFGTFHNSENDPILKQFKSDNYLSNILEDSKGTIYISSRQYIFILDNQNNFKKITLDESIYKMWLTADDDLEVFTSGGLSKINKNYEVIPIQEKYSEFSRGIRVNNELYYSTHNNFYKYEKTQDTLFTLNKELLITWLGKVQHEENKIYIGSKTGLYIYSIDEKQLTQEHYLKESVITHTLEDDEGNLWITTEGDGIFLSHSPYIKIINQNNGLSENQITCLQRGLDNDLWIGMKRGYYSNLKDEKISNYRIKANPFQPVRHILIVGANDIFILNRTNLVQINKEKTKEYKYGLNDILIDSNYCYIAKRALIRIPTSFFINNLKKEKEGLKILDIATEENSILNKNTGVLERGRKGVIYIGTQKGLYRDEALKLTNLGLKEERLKGTVNDLAFDEKRNLLYVASSNNGLILLENDSIKYIINSENGLLSDNCRSIFLDDNGSLWVASSNSFMRITYTNEKLKLFNYGNLLNLQSKKIIDIEKDGNILYLATDYGLFVIDLKKYRQINSSPKIYLQSIVVNDEINKEIEKPLNLSHYENTISFNFISLSYKSLGNITYKFKLEGLHKNWHITKERTVSFETLKSGDYTFKLIATNSLNQESEMIVFPFSIAIPIWKKTGFIISAILLLILLIGSIIYSRTQRIRKQYELEKQIVASEIEKLELEKAYLLAEQKAGVLQMNPHFLFNSLNTIKGYYAQNKFSEANRFISKFSKLLRRILECNTQFISLEKEIEILSIYLELMQKRHDNLFEYEVISDIDMSEKYLIPPMILQPLIENAVIHGIVPANKGYVKVHFFQENDYLKCTVIDNGVGFNHWHKQTHESVGISNIKDRLALLSKQFNMNCTLEIISPNNTENSTGTRVNIQLPLKLIENESNNN